MAEEVTKTIENVDRLFARIVVNGEVHESQNYVPQDSTDSIIAPQITEESNQDNSQEPIAQPTQDVGEDVYSVVLNDTQHDFVDPETVQNLSAEVLARQGADTLLQQGITGLTGDVADINDKIPNQASSTNQLADKNFVNSSIATNTANFLGTYTSMAEIEAIQDPTNNDYVFLQTTDASGNNLFDRYKYNADQDEWLFEYELNNSSFTAEQWATINSGLTQQSVTQQIEEATSDIRPQALFDLVHPIGEVYVQFPAQLDPQTLYNMNGIQSTWVKQNYSGAFFRADGGNAEAFQTTLGSAQGQATAKNGLSISNTLSVGSASSGGTANVTASGGVDHTHNMQHKHTRGTMNITGTIQNPNGTFHVMGFESASSNFTGAFSGSNFTGYSRTGQSSSHAGAKVMEFDASKTWAGVTSDSLTNTSTSTSPTAKDNTGGASAYSHSHNVYLRGGVSLGNGDTETRPTNYTIQIWKRTA